MITIKTQEEIAILREGGKRLAFILSELEKMVAPGISTQDLDDRARELALEGGDELSLLNYQPDGARRPYPASMCVSINDEVVHGIPSKDRVLKEGDIVGLDFCITHKGLVVDSAITVSVGKIDDEAKRLLKITREAMYKGIEAARGGARIGDIGHAIETFVATHGFSNAEGLAGHGVGYSVHEEPYVPNTGEKGTGMLLKSGMVISVEPMLNIGTGKIKLDRDGYTFRTRDGKRSAHFEHTIAITDGAAIILTKGE
jgi:methionyl aminopeptidase